MPVLSNYDHTRGARNGNAKLTADQVIAIRASTTPPKILAFEHRTSVATISQIKNGRTWTSVPLHPVAGNDNL